MLTVYSHQVHGKETDAQIPAHSSHHGHCQENQWQEMLVRMVEKKNLKTKQELPLDSITPIPDIHQGHQSHHSTVTPTD